MLKIIKIKMHKNTLLIGILLLFASINIACTGIGNAGKIIETDWHVEVIAEVGDDWPDMLLLHGDYLFYACELKANMLSPSLARIHLPTGKREVLIYGLNRADSLQWAPDGSLWLGEESSHGHIWRISEPWLLPPEQRIDRKGLQSSHLSIQAVIAAGRFAHEGIAFSADGMYAYLADEDEAGGMYRLHMHKQQLQVLTRHQGWQTINNPENARQQAEILQVLPFQRLEDMHRMPDGSIWVAETDTGTIWRLDDSSTSNKPRMTIELKNTRIPYPDNLHWDKTRQWLWVTDDNEPSALWRWHADDGWQRIALSNNGEITGVITDKQGRIYISLQHRSLAPDLILRLSQNKHTNKHKKERK